MSGNNSSFEWCTEFENEALCHAVNGIGCAMGVISIISCVFIIGEIIRTQKYKNPSHRVLLYTVVALMLQSAQFAWSHIIFANEEKYHTFCVFQAFFAQVTSAITLGWMIVITFNVVWIGMLIKTPGWKLEVIEFILAIVPAFVISLIPFATGDFGPSGFWCWITASDKDGNEIISGLVLQFLLFYFPYLLGNIIVTIVLIISICVIQQRLRKSRKFGGAAHDYQETIWKNDVRPLFWLPWFIIIVWIIPLINRIRLGLGFGEDESGWHFFFWFSHSFSRPLAPVLFAVIILVDRLKSVASAKKKRYNLNCNTQKKDSRNLFQ